MHSTEVPPILARLLPDTVWRVAEPLIPAPTPRPQGGGRKRFSNRAVLTAIIYILTSGCAWRRLPPSFGVTVPTTYRRYVEWCLDGFWERLQKEYETLAAAESSAETPISDEYLWVVEIAKAAHDRFSEDYYN